MNIALRVYELDDDPNAFSRLLHATLQHVCGAQFSRHLTQIFRTAFVFGGRGARNHLKIADLSDCGEDFILDTVGKIGVVRIVAQIFERQHPQLIFVKL